LAFKAADGSTLGYNVAFGPLAWLLAGVEQNALYNAANCSVGANNDTIGAACNRTVSGARLSV